MRKNNDNKPKISIIVPIYNVAAYVEHTVEMICAQSYQNLEIILVDDGSTDDSGNICDRYSERDPRIKVLHIDNGGQSRARNMGLEIATGDYIGFVDGDDAPYESMYQRMVDVALGENASIVECNFTGRKSDAVDLPTKKTVAYLTGEEALRRQLEYSRISSYPSTSVWSKLFRRDIVEDLRFPEGRIHEEFAYLAESFLRCDKYAYINEELYERILRNDSTTAKPYSKRSWDKYYVYQLRHEVINKLGNRELKALSAQCIRELRLSLIKQWIKSVVALNKKRESL